MKQSYDLDLFYTMLISYLDDLETETDFPIYFYQALYEGKNVIKNQVITETKKFDDYWISAIEAYYPSIDKIARNYKSILRSEEEVVVIEKAKKTDSRTVRHLAANTHLLKEPDKKTNKNAGPIPTKLLVKQTEIEYGIYENRFIASLIRKVSKFVGDRLKIIKEYVDTTKLNKIDSDLSFKMENSTFNVHIDLSETENINVGKIEEENQRLLKRVEELNKKVNSLVSSTFMKVLKPYKPVKAPIMKTQIILKNVDYKNCYNLWQYLDQYNSLGYELIKDEKQKRFDESYRKHLQQASMFMFATLLYHDFNRTKNEKLLSHKYKLKKAEQIVINPESVETDPQEYEIEDSKINEFYLNKNKQIFKANIDKYVESETKYEIALKKALKDTIEITNSLYASYFEVNTDKDVFDQLITQTHPKNDLDEADKKFKIAQIIRELKESDYKQAIALEKKWYGQVLNYQKGFFKWVNEENSEFLKKDLEKVQKANKEYLKLERKKILDEKRLQVATDNQALLDLKNKYREQFKKEAERIALIQKKKAEREHARLMKERELAKQKLEKARKMQADKRNAFVKKQKEKIRTSHQKAMQSLKKK